MTKPRLYFDMIKLLAKKVREQAIPPRGNLRRRPLADELTGSPLLNFMFVSNHCKQAILGQFGEVMTEVVFDGKEVFFWDEDDESGQFIASPWFLAYLIHYGQLRMQKLVFVGEGVLVACKRDLGDCDLYGVRAIDVFSMLVGFEEEEPGLSAHQAVDLQLERVAVEHCVRRSGNEDLDLNKFLALQPKKCVVFAKPAVSILMPQRASFPRVSEIYIANPSPHLDWTLLLSRMIDACPNLTSIWICFYKNKVEDTLFDVVTQFRDEIFPSLPQETKAVVTIDYDFITTRQEFEKICNHPLFGDFNEEAVPEDPNRGVHLCRAMRWERGEGMKPWRVLLTIDEHGMGWLGWCIDWLRWFCL